MTQRKQGPIKAFQIAFDSGDNVTALQELRQERALLPAVVREVLKPLRLWSNALLLVDSPHGDGPTLDLPELPVPLLQAAPDGLPALEP